MSLYLALAGASFLYVFLKAFQQRSVASDSFIAILPVSLGLAAMEVFTTAKVAATGWHIGVVLAIGLSSGSGAMVAMLIHRRLFPTEPRPHPKEPNDP